MTDAPHPSVVRGRDALARGDLRAAIAAADERLRSNARDTQALEIRFLAQQGLGEAARAMQTLQSVLEIDPRADWAYNDLVRLLYATGRRTEADQVARTALRMNPRNAEAHGLFGTLLSESNDLPSGEWHFRRALELGGENAAFLTNLAISLMNQGKLEEADACFAHADARSPGNLLTLGHWSKLYELRGDLKHAQELLDRAEAASSIDAVKLLRASYFSRQGRAGEALAILEHEPTLNGDALLERGRLYDRLGRFEEAWRDFVDGKKKLATQGGGLSYNAPAVETFFARLKEFFVRSRFDLLPSTQERSDSPQPIFIVGFPRSGTTHDRTGAVEPFARARGRRTLVHGGIRRLANLLFPGPEPFPENLTRTFTADNRFAATLFRDYYFARAEQYGLLEPGKAFFTDKMPFNEIWLPLLRMASRRRASCASCVIRSMYVFPCWRITSPTDSIAATASRTSCITSPRCSTWSSTTGASFGAELMLKYESFVANQREETRRLARVCRVCRSRSVR